MLDLGINLVSGSNNKGISTSAVSIPILTNKNYPIKKGTETTTTLMKPTEVFVVDKARVAPGEIQLDRIKVGPRVTESQKQALHKLRNNYRDCFAMNLQELD